MTKIVPTPPRSEMPIATEPRVVRMEIGQDSARARADLVFVIDTTGSMNDKIDGLIESCQSFVDKLAAKRIDWAAAVVGFGDLTVEGDRIVATPFSSSAERVKALLRGLPRYSGGGNEGESSLEALQTALGQPGYRPDAMKVFVLITDEPALQKTCARQRCQGGCAKPERLPLSCRQTSSTSVLWRPTPAANGGMWILVATFPRSLPFSTRSQRRLPPR
jgi:hypothetical protein